jgi:hypothetical protein
MLESLGIKRGLSVGLLAGGSIAFNPPPSNAAWGDAVLPEIAKSTAASSANSEFESVLAQLAPASPISDRKSADNSPTANKLEEANWKTISLSILSCLMALPGYALAFRRGTPIEKRENNLVYRALDAITPDPTFFPNNRATWIASAANSSALFGLGMLQALSQGQPFGAALTSLSVIGMYGLGAMALAYNSLRHGRSFEMSAVDRTCLIGGLVGVGTLMWSGLTRAGLLPPVGMPLDMFGIVTALTVRSIALVPLLREFFVCARTSDPDKLRGGFPNLASHAFWVAPVLLNMLNPQALASKAGIVPIVVSIQGAICLTVGSWAYRKFTSRAAALASPK